jgi:hypothetical protein
MQPRRLSVKYFVRGEIAFDVPAVFPVFQRWIQEHSVEGLLIDVADYSHVQHGPGIVLIGHEGDYSFDLKGGRPGLAYTRKREHQGSLADELRLAFRLAEAACKQLEAEADLNGIRFNYGDAEITFLDRLNTPNIPETFENFREDLQKFAQEQYQTETARVESVEADPRKNLIVRIATSQESVVR